MRLARGNTTDPFADAGFRMLWGSRLIQALGGSFLPVAMAFTVIRIGGSASELGGVLASGALVQLVFLVLGGVWGDRVSRKQIMIGVNLGRAAVQSILAVLVILGDAHVWHLILANVLLAIGTGLFRPASTGLVAEVVPAARLQQANAWLSVGEGTTAVVGPATAGVLVALFGPGWALASYAVAFAVSTVLLARVKLPLRSPQPQRRTFLADVVNGWKEIVTRPWCWQNLVTHGLWNLAFSMLYVLGPIIATTRLGGAPGWGVISSGMAVGSVAGGVLAIRIRPRRPLVFGNLALLAGAAPPLVFAARLSIGYAFTAMVVAAAGLAVLNTAWESTLQQLVPLNALSRVSAYDWFVSTTLTPLGILMAAPLLGQFGMTDTLLLGAALVIVPSFLVVMLPSVRGVQRLPDGTTVTRTGGFSPVETANALVAETPSA